MIKTQIFALVRRSGSRYRNHICASTILAACSLAVLLLPAVATVETGPPLTSFRAELRREPAGRSNMPGFGNARNTNLVQTQSGQLLKRRDKLHTSGGRSAVGCADSPLRCDGVWASEAALRSARSSIGGAARKATRSSKYRSSWADHSPAIDIGVLFIVADLVSRRSTPTWVSMSPRYRYSDVGH